MDKYIKNAIRTDLSLADYIIGPKKRLESEIAVRLLHGIMGVSTEAGELLDQLKKHLMYGKQLDFVNIAEEIGDVLWYCAIILDEIEMDFEEVMLMNINKLEKRFPEKFDNQKALVRDLETERKQLESDY